jgi:hypothetical protein
MGIRHAFETKHLGIRTGTFGPHVLYNLKNESGRKKQQRGPRVCCYCYRSEVIQLWGVPPLVLWGGGMSCLYEGHNYFE